MYNTKHECRYYKQDIFLETDDVTNNEKDYIRHILYEEDMLIIFGIQEQNFNDIFSELNLNFSELYLKLKDNELLMKCMKHVARDIFSESEDFGLCILYSYDYMYITHKCVSEYLDKGLISDENIELLNKCVLNS